MSDRSIGILGCGKQGKKHAAAFRASGVGVVCADADRDAAQSLATRCGGRAVDVRELLTDTGIGGVVVATPTPTHFEFISEALRAGKHVLCEKPLAGNVTEAKALERLERQAGRYVGVGFLYRYVPAFERIQELAKCGTLGSPVHAVLRIGGRGNHRLWKHTREEGGGVLNEMAVHMLDLALWLFGPLGQPRVVAAAQLSPQRQIAGRPVAVDADDYLVVQAEAESGALVLMVADMLTPGFVQYIDAQYENASVFGSIVPTFPSRLFIQEARGGMEAGEQTLGGSNAALYRRQAEAFLRVVSTAVAPDRNRIADSIAVGRLAEEISKQIAAGADALGPEFNRKPA